MNLNCRNVRLGRNPQSEILNPQLGRAPLDECGSIGEADACCGHKHSRPILYDFSLQSSVQGDDDIVGPVMSGVGQGVGSFSREPQAFQHPAPLSRKEMPEGQIIGSFTREPRMTHGALDQSHQLRGYALA